MAAKGRQTQEADDGKRPESGVAVCIVEGPGGKARLVFDDISRVGACGTVQWSTEWFFTRVEFDLADLIDGALDEQDYLNIGQAIVARLAARYQTRGHPAEG